MTLPLLLSMFVLTLCFLLEILAQWNSVPIRVHAPKQEVSQSSIPEQSAAGSIGAEQEELTSQLQCLEGRP